MSWLSEEIDKRLTDLRKRQMQAFVADLADMTDDDVAVVLVCANHHRQRIEHVKQWDLLRPNQLGDAVGQAITHFDEMIRQLQRGGQRDLARGAMVWLLTLCGSKSPDCQRLVLHMWEELSRGFAHIEQACRRHSEAAGETFDATGADEIPEGFKPSGGGDGD